MTFKTALAGGLALAALTAVGCAESSSKADAPAKQSTAGATADSAEAAIAANKPAPAAYLSRPPEDEVVYFMLPDRFANGNPDNDRGGIEGGPLDHGFDPTHKGFYQGGDLEGLTGKLDYIQGMGVTAIWLGPIYQNKAVQGGAGQESAGYHGYWITDFTRADAHYGTDEELKHFIDSAHARGIKIYLDIITNHTADVISYRECHDPDYQGTDKVTGGCPYRSKADYPFTTRGGVDGEKINDGFMGDTIEFQTAENMARLTRPDFAYTPYVPAGEENVKIPAWLNDIRYYHNRGETTFIGENSVYGDFAGLDDLNTEDPFVIDGFIDIYKDWITRYRIDGFRIDTAKHVNPEFWQKFLPEVIDHAKAEGIPNFYVFGEASYSHPEGGTLAMHTLVDDFPYVLDFAFQGAVEEVVASNVAPVRLAELFQQDVLYKGGEKTALGLPVFIGNHDVGRFAHFVAKENPSASEAEMTARVELGHALMFFARGVPVIYYGDEQGFIGDGHDQDARETMFPTEVASYDDNNLLGTDKKSTVDNFDTDHPLYQAFARMAEIYHDHPALRRGKQIVRRADIEAGGIFALSRMDAETDREYLAVFNFGSETRTVTTETDPRSDGWTALVGSCDEKSPATGIARVTVPAYGYTVCRADR